MYSVIINKIVKKQLDKIPIVYAKKNSLCYLRFGK